MRRFELYSRVKTQQNLFKIRSAFEAWKRYKGPAGQQPSERNRKQALTTLERELTAAGADLRTYQLTGNRFTMQGYLQALAFIARERKRSSRGCSPERKWHSATRPARSSRRLPTRP